MTPNELKNLEEILRETEMDKHLHLGGFTPRQERWNEQQWNKLLDPLPRKDQLVLSLIFICSAPFAFLMGKGALNNLKENLKDQAYTRRAQITLAKRKVK